MKQHSKPQTSTKQTHERTFPVQAHIGWQADHAKVTMERRDGQAVFRISMSDYTHADGDQGSLSALTQRFFSVSSEVDALEFLAVTCGLIFEPLDLFPKSPSIEATREMTWEQFKGYQDLARFLAVNGFLYDDTSQINWVHNNVPVRIQNFIDQSPKPILDWVTGEPTQALTLAAPCSSQKARLWIMTSSALEAIIASLWLDRLAGDSFRQCGLRGCSKVYSMEGQRADKFYCCTDHARHASIRRSREKKAATKKTTKAVKNGK